MSKPVRRAPEIGVFGRGSESQPESTVRAEKAGEGSGVLRGQISLQPFTSNKFLAFLFGIGHKVPEFFLSIQLANQEYIV